MQLVGEVWKMLEAARCMQYHWINDPRVEYPTEKETLSMSLVGA